LLNKEKGKEIERDTACHSARNETPARKRECGGSGVGGQLIAKKKKKPTSTAVTTSERTTEPRKQSTAAQEKEDQSITQHQGIEKTEIGIIPRRGKGEELREVHFSRSRWSRSRKRESLLEEETQTAKNKNARLACGKIWLRGCDNRRNRTCKWITLHPDQTSSSKDGKRGGAYRSSKIEKVGYTLFLNPGTALREKGNQAR